MQSYFSDMSLQLFSNVHGLLEQVEAWFAETGAQDSPVTDLSVSDVTKVHSACELS